jgi:hypothetical protein
VCQSIFDSSAVYRLQKNASQKPNRIRGAKVEWALPHSINRFLQQSAHVTDALQWNCREISVCRLPMTVRLSSLSAKLGESLGMRMKKAQAAFHGGRRAHISSLRLSLAPLSAPLFRAFLSLKANGGTLRRLGHRPSLVDAATILLEEQAVLGCAGDADFAELCRNLPTYPV